MIREATERDAAKVSEIYNHYIQNTVITFEESLITESEFVERIRRVQAAGYSWLVAVENEEIVGYAYSSKWNERTAYRNTAEVSVYLSHTATSAGWGTRLYEVLFSTLQEKGIHSVIAGVSLPNSSSVAIHEKFGMEKVAHFKEVGFKFGKWLDVGYWQVQLNA
ncbi:MAG: GNAT family N-acetyltransferase [Agarilytica sp.]